MFEIGYPYIGFSEAYFDKISSILTEQNPAIKCEKGKHWGMCRVYAIDCDHVNLDHDLTIAINDVNFIIPLRNMAVIAHEKHGNYYC